MSEMKLFRKRKGTGMHVAFLRKGSLYNGQPFAGRCVIRPGNTVMCVPDDLGVVGLTQFEEIGSSEKRAKPTVPSSAKPLTKLLPELRSRGRGYYDVINPSDPTGKPYNEKALRKEEAVALIKDITEGNFVLPKDQPGPIDRDSMGWDELVKELEDRGVAWDDSWKDEEDLRTALHSLDQE